MALESVPAEQFYFWASPSSPSALWDLYFRLLQWQRQFSRQVCSPRGRVRRSVSHCPSTGTAASESCSNTAAEVGKIKHFCKLSEKNRQKTDVKSLRDCWGRNKGQSEGRSNSQRTHQTGRWMYLELSTQQGEYCLQMTANTLSLLLTVVTNVVGLQCHCTGAGGRSLSRSCCSAGSRDTGCSYGGDRHRHSFHSC